MAVIGRFASAIRGAVGFLTRLPVGGGEEAWEAFCAHPWVAVAVAYPLGVVVALPLLAPLPAGTVAVAVAAWLLVITGITHLDGLVDLGDAAVVHGDAERRRSIMRDTEVGVGGVAAGTLALLAVGAAGFELADESVATAITVVVAAEVGAKLALLSVVGAGTPAHDGLGSSVADGTGLGGTLAGLSLAVPLVPLAGSVGIAALAASGMVAAGLLWWARTRLGGTSGDVFGATNDLARIAALHAGTAVVALDGSVGDAGVIGGVGSTWIVEPTIGAVTGVAFTTVFEVLGVAAVIAAEPPRVILWTLS